jgi:hypothetical protein
VLCRPGRCDIELTVQSKIATRFALEWCSLALVDIGDEDYRDWCSEDERKHLEELAERQLRDGYES